jgi:hypothetical protein
MPQPETNNENNVKIVFNIPDEPAVLAAACRAVDIVGQQVAYAAGEDMQARNYDEIDPDKQGKVMSGREWMEYLDELSTLYRNLGELSTRMFVSDNGKDHPISKLAKTLEENLSPKEFVQAIRKAVLESGLDLSVEGLTAETLDDWTAELRAVTNRMMDT